MNASHSASYPFAGPGTPPWRKASAGINLGLPAGETIGGARWFS